MTKPRSIRMAPRRRRPKRITKKIARRGGLAHYPRRDDPVAQLFMFALVFKMAMPRFRVSMFTTPTPKHERDNWVRVMGGAP